MSKTYCYIRISTDKQEHERQKSILKEKGYINGVNCEYIEETYTGKTTKRPALTDLINKLQKDDTIVATELSRISRSVKDFNNLIDEILNKKKVNIIIIKENFHLLANGKMDAMTKLILNITSAFAEFERDIIADRTREALKAKKKNNIILGKPRGEKSSKDNFIKTIELMVNDEIGQRKAAMMTGYPERTFKKDLKKCYDKYKTKDYKKILKAIKEDI